jgi:site-specific DNA recombinase
MSNRAAAYMRISEDRTGESFGVGTQRKRITALIEAKGWELVQEFTDNSVSASKARGKGTAWADMLAAAERGRVRHDCSRRPRPTAEATQTC